MFNCNNTKTLVLAREVMAKKGPNNKIVDKGILGKNERTQMKILGNITATKM